ncbi:hypothetical protein MWU54_08525 [Marivita sp. S6314]|uniref:hypothetical protein n=1 Tax=Marivita sp. S6314 TaxID=2926406 RepID=UPI001FF56DC4|nr:hypothetical protein [Marivita sp. S6314]MCK0150062.1 hypothetical protein [Marivita sp. S6314]
MAERHRSKDGRRETEEVLGAEGEIAHSGRTGGRLSRTVGTEDELKRATERPAGATRVRKSMEEDSKDG